MTELPIQPNQNNNQLDSVKPMASESSSGDMPSQKKLPSDSQPKIKQLKKSTYTSSDSQKIKPQKSDFQAPKTQTPPAVDGILNDDCWKDSVVLTDFVSENTGQSIKDQTKVYMTYDDKNIYLGFECFETDISKLKCEQRVKDQSIHFDDLIGIFIDTLDDGKGIYKFYVNPLGTQGDKSTRDTNWDYTWQSAAKIYPDKWTVEVAIPFEKLRIQNKDKQDWRINFWRDHKHSILKSIWSYQGRNFSRDPLYFPKIKNLDIPIKGKPEFIEYSLFKTQKDKDSEIHAGLDIKYPLTNQLNANFTINPDFSDVEADELTTAPQQFTRFLSEYRPFFKEGSEFFTQSTSIGFPGVFDLFHSRNIPQIDAGAKISGKIGDLATGILFTQSPDQRQDQVAKLKYSLGDDVDLGAMSVEKKDQGDSSKSTAFEGQVRFSKNLIFSGLLSNTQNNYDPASKSNNQGNLTNLDYLTDNISLSLGCLDIGKNFNPPDGYIQMKDIKGPFGFIGFSDSFDTGSVAEYGLNVYGGDYKTHQGEPHYKFAGANAFVENRKNQFFSYSYDEDTLKGLKSHTNSFTLGLNSNAWNSTWASYSEGTFENNPYESYSISTGVPLSEQLRMSYSLESSEFTQDQKPLRLLYHRMNLLYEIDKKNTLGVQCRVDEAGKTNLYGIYRKRMGTNHDLYIRVGQPNTLITQPDVLIKYSFPLGK